MKDLNKKTENILESSQKVIEKSQQIQNNVESSERNIRLVTLNLEEDLYNERRRNEEVLNINKAETQKAKDSYTQSIDSETEKLRKNSASQRAEGDRALDASMKENNEKIKNMPKYNELSTLSQGITKLEADQRKQKKQFETLSDGLEKFTKESAERRAAFEKERHENEKKRELIRIERDRIKLEQNKNEIAPNSGAQRKKHAAATDEQKKDEDATRKRNFKRKIKAIERVIKKNQSEETEKYEKEYKAAEMEFKNELQKLNALEEEEIKKYSIKEEEKSKEIKESLEQEEKTELASEKASEQEIIQNKKIAYKNSQRSLDKSVERDSNKLLIYVDAETHRNEIKKSDYTLELMDSMREMIKEYEQIKESGVEYKENEWKEFVSNNLNLSQEMRSLLIDNEIINDDLNDFQFIENKFIYIDDENEPNFSRITSELISWMKKLTRDTEKTFICKNRKIDTKKEEFTHLFEHGMESPEKYLAEIDILQKEVKQFLKKCTYKDMDGVDFIIESVNSETDNILKKLILESNLQIETINDPGERGDETACDLFSMLNTFSTTLNTQSREAIEKIKQKDLLSNRESNHNEKTKEEKSPSIVIPENNTLKLILYIDNIDLDKETLKKGIDIQIDLFCKKFNKLKLENPECSSAKYMQWLDSELNEEKNINLKNILFYSNLIGGSSSTKGKILLRQNDAMHSKIRQNKKAYIEEMIQVLGKKDIELIESLTPENTIEEKVVHQGETIAAKKKQTPLTQEEKNSAIKEFAPEFLETETSNTAVVEVPRPTLDLQQKAEDDEWDLVIRVIKACQGPFDDQSSPTRKNVIRTTEDRGNKRKYTYNPGHADEAIFSFNDREKTTNARKFKGKNGNETALLLYMSLVTQETKQKYEIKDTNLNKDEIKSLTQDLFSCRKFEEIKAPISGIEEFYEKIETSIQEIKKESPIEEIEKHKAPDVNDLLKRGSADEFIELVKSEKQNKKYIEIVKKYILQNLENETQPTEIIKYMLTDYAHSSDFKRICATKMHDTVLNLFIEYGALRETVSSAVRNRRIRTISDSEKKITFSSSDSSTAKKEKLAILVEIYEFRSKIAKKENKTESNLNINIETKILDFIKNDVKFEENNKSNLLLITLAKKLITDKTDAEISAIYPKIIKATDNYDTKNTLISLLEKSKKHVAMTSVLSDPNISLKGASNKTLKKLIKNNMHYNNALAIKKLELAISTSEMHQKQKLYLHNKIVRGGSTVNAVSLKPKKGFEGFGGFRYGFFPATTGHTNLPSTGTASPRESQSNSNAAA